MGFDFHRRNRRQREESKIRDANQDVVVGADKIQCTEITCLFGEGVNSCDITLR